MSKTVSATDVRKNFGVYHDHALSEPVRVTKYGRETVYILLAKTFHAQKQAQRAAVASTQLSDDEMTLVNDAGIPGGHRCSLDKFWPGAT